MKKILVVRNDKIGDFMLAWPSFAMLKQSLPDCHITALVPHYTVELAKLCPWIDSVIIDCGAQALKSEKKALINQIRSESFDTAIAFLSNTYNAMLLWNSKIPYRLAPATKWSQIFYNHKLTQRRSRSEKPEYQYNLDLIRYFLQQQQCHIIEPTTPYLVFSEQKQQLQKQKLAQQLELDSELQWCFVHSGSGGSANNLSLAQYVEVIATILKAKSYQIVLTAGPGEALQAKQLKQLLADVNIAAVVYDKNEGLSDFTASIACADLFVAGSTGPLHIAAAVDVPTIGFFPSKRSATPLRWLPLNSEGRHIAFCPPQGMGQETDMSQIIIASLMTDLHVWLAER